MKAPPRRQTPNPKLPTRPRMTISEIHALRAERVQIQNLLGDLAAAQRMLHTAEHLGDRRDQLVAGANAHQTLAHCQRYRAAEGLCDAPVVATFRLRSPAQAEARDY